MEIEKEINDLVTNIRNAHKGNKFPSYIESIRFPYYKNLIQDAEIKFDFPFTVLIGKNGSGKSSALHAIYGCPGGKSTGDYWFSTPLDPIKQNRLKGEIPSVIYTYKHKKKYLEVIKRRSGVSKGLDYWETSRPIKMYNMKPLEDGKRNPPLKKDVKFLDFRSELSAFDKFFHFGQFKSRKTITSKQDYLRKYTKYVKSSFTSNTPSSVYNKSSKKPQAANEDSLNIISEILGKSYSSCKILFHEFYGEDGATVQFQQYNKSYSEAFAGRGEYAVVKLIYELTQASVGSLIILDEPEVSLHPYAQEKLKLYLLRICLEKKLQIVISTHSPKLIEFLPNEAIKLFFEDDNGQFNISNNCSYHEAFHRIGERINKTHIKTIIVEDSLAKLLIEKTLAKMGGDYPILFEVVYFPGGAEHAIKSSALYSQENETNKFLLLDGDKRKPQFDPDNFTAKECDDLSFLKTKLKESTGIEFSAMVFKIDGNRKGGNEVQQKEVIKKYLNYQRENIDYLPLNTPEEFLWDEAVALGLLKKVVNNDIIFEGDHKEKFRHFSMLLFGKDNADYIEKSQEIFINKFLDNEGEHYKSIIDTIKKFKL